MHPGKKKFKEVKNSPMLEHIPIAAAADFNTFSDSWINVFEKGFRRRDKIRRQTPYFSGHQVRRFYKTAGFSNSNLATNHIQCPSFDTSSIANLQHSHFDSSQLLHASYPRSTNLGVLDTPHIPCQRL